MDRDPAMGPRFVPECQTTAPVTRRQPKGGSRLVSVKDAEVAGI